MIFRKPLRTSHAKLCLRSRAPRTCCSVSMPRGQARGSSALQPHARHYRAIACTESYVMLPGAQGDVGAGAHCAPAARRAPGARPGRASARAGRRPPRPARARARAPPAARGRGATAPRAAPPPRARPPRSAPPPPGARGRCVSTGSGMRLCKHVSAAGRRRTCLRASMRPAQRRAGAAQCWCGRPACMLRHAKCRT